MMRLSASNVDQDFRRLSSNSDGVFTIVKKWFKQQSHVIKYGKT